MKGALIGAATLLAGLLGITDIEDDLATARTSLRLMIPAENLSSPPLAADATTPPPKAT